MIKIALTIFEGSPDLEGLKQATKGFITDITVVSSGPSFPVERYCRSHNWKFLALTAEDEKSFDSAVHSIFPDDTVFIRGGNKIPKNLLHDPVIKESPVIATAKPQLHITTYNRPDTLKLLLQDIEEDVEVFVHDDGSTVDYTEALTLIHSHGYHFISYPHSGKRGYCQRIRTILRQATAPFFFLQDDVRLCKDFFSKSLTLLGNKHALYLFNDGGGDTARWFGNKHRSAGNLEETGWLDCAAFLLDTTALNCLKSDLQTPAAEWFDNAKHGSGSGRQISLALRSKKIQIYRVKNSLIFHNSALPSLMNQQNRKAEILATHNFVDGSVKNLLGTSQISVNIASIPSRHQQLLRTLQSLDGQADVINVYLNNYNFTPKYPGVNFYHGKDIGDIGKFFWVEDFTGWYLTCDDDIIYPQDYVQTLICYAQQNDCVVGVHGSILKQPFKTYKTSRELLHFTAAVKQLTAVHLLGTGTTAFHTSKIDIKLKRFEHPNMADIWFAIQAQEQAIPLKAVPRTQQWLIPQETAESIYNNPAKLQDKVIAGRQWTLDVSRVKGTAAFLVPTTNRPDLLRACLTSIKEQVIPVNWKVEVVVCGSPEDIGRSVAQEFGYTYVESLSPYPGQKLNTAAQQTSAQLLLAADDDDIQDPKRLQLTVEAYLGGAEWISTGSIFFYDTADKSLALWEGPGEQVGTTTSLSRQAYDYAEGWPAVNRGKEGLLIKRLQNKYQFADLSAILKNTVCLQHSHNIWPRPFPKNAKVVEVGNFKVTGKSTRNLPVAARKILKSLKLS